MRIGIVGASGFVGARLCALAAEVGHEVVRFSRVARTGYRGPESHGGWDFSGLDAVVNLAGEPVLGIWTEEKKRRILESRVVGTRRVVAGMDVQGGPRVLVNASAIGFYGDTGDRTVDESASAGAGFLAETCVAWEAEAVTAERAGVRVVCLRIGFVVGDGGAMKLVMPIFRLGLGGNLGNGRQWMSCVHVDDVAGLALWSVENADVVGALNAVIPEPVRNADFTRKLAAAVRRPAFLPAPAFALRTVLGGVSHVMLDSARVVPRVALEKRYEFRYSTLDAAFTQVVG